MIRIATANHPDKPMKTLLTTCLLASLLAVATTISSTAQTVQPATVPTPSADSTNLSAYIGVYSFNSGSPIQKFTVTTEKGELYGEADGFGRNKLVKQAKADTYQSTSSYGSIITFVRDAKAVTGLTLAAQGTELVGKKANP
ncbi:MAG: hypothetical protein JWP57_1993 [Spirosoma sp.]|nr:hypothetical protein [Spirosoma sp.]